MSFYPELDGLTLDQLIVRFRAAPPDDEADCAALWYMEIGYAIRRHGDEGVAFLRGEREAVERDEDRLRGILCGLAWPPMKHPSVRQDFRALLHDPRDVIVMDAIGGLTACRDRRALADVVALRTHESGWVRGTVLRYLQECFPRDAIPAALSGLADPHYITRESAIDVLDELGVVAEHEERIRPFLNDPHPDVRGAAEWAIAAAHWEDVDSPDRE